MKVCYNATSFSDDQPVQDTLNLNDRIGGIQKRIGEAAQRSNRAVSAVTLLAATKTVDATVILDAMRCGIRHIGENRVQEAAAKSDALKGAAGLTRHFIGQLQTNKVRQAVGLFDVIQSVDRFRLAEAIDRVAGDAGKRQRCLVEVKISEDAAKGGASIDDARRLVDDMGKLKSVQIEGLMGIAPNDVDEGRTRAAFATLSRLFSDLRGAFGPAPTLSMGMTEDFEMAIEEGATMVRIGRALFGERKTA